MVWYDRTVYIPYTVRPPDTYVIKRQMYLRMHNNMYMYQHAMAGILFGWAAYIYMVVAVPVQWQEHI